MYCCPHCKKSLTENDTLTPRQQDVYRFVVDFRHKHEYSPTTQEMADGIGVSKVTIWEVVQQLVAKRWLYHRPNKARSLMPVEELAQEA